MLTWIIGYLFVLGMIVETNDLHSNEKWMSTIVSLFIWPLAIGAFVMEIWNDYKAFQERDTP